MACIAAFNMQSSFQARLPVLRLTAKEGCKLRHKKVMRCLTLRTEGVLGLYRGFNASVMMFVPSSAIWWGSYGGCAPADNCILADLCTESL